MVDVSDKPTTARTATAECDVLMEEATLERIRDGAVQKGDVLGVARLAAIQATKWTSQLIPLCHAIPVEGVEVGFEFPSERCVRCRVSVRTSGKTGVEMEALTAVTVAGLTIYDMCKSLDRGMEIGPARLISKDGGASGRFRRQG
jgi:cyclic pyranopterin phosphate synthase